MRPTIRPNSVSERFVAVVKREIAEHGHFHVSKETGLFIATK